jgi:cytochrome oxidase Cu insertion factor (SCO1/SenC/PrrC family)
MRFTSASVRRIRLSIVRGRLRRAYTFLNSQRLTGRTVNPRVDTPARVRRFLRERDALGEVDYLIGTAQRLCPVWTAFAIVPAVDTCNADVHSADVRIFDRRGVWVTTLHTGVDLTPDNVAHDIRAALRD